MTRLPSPLNNQPPPTAAGRELSVATTCRVPNSTVPERTITGRFDAQTLRLLSSDSHSWRLELLTHLTDHCLVGPKYSTADPKKLLQAHASLQNGIELYLGMGEAGDLFRLSTSCRLSKIESILPRLVPSGAGHLSVDQDRTGKTFGLAIATGLARAVRGPRGGDLLGDIDVETKLANTLVYQLVDLTISSRLAEKYYAVPRSGAKASPHKEFVFGEAKALKIIKHDRKPDLLLTELEKYSPQLDPGDADTLKLYTAERKAYQLLRALLGMATLGSKPSQVKICERADHIAHAAGVVLACGQHQKMTQSLSSSMRSTT